MIGETLHNRYRLEERVGRGAFGEVYSGFDQQLKRRVAVKVLLRSGEDDHFKERLVKESELQARLSHPNIVTVYDFGEENGKAYLVMEYIDGFALLQACDEMRTNIPRILDVAGGVCDAMEHAHQKGVIHRDLTLRNIMIDGQGRVRVLDFGLSKVALTQSQTNSGAIVGTPAYMAPEQATGRPIDSRADIFAFGVCLYRMLCGRFPFEAEHPAAMLYVIGNENPPPLPPEIPTDLQDLVLACLEKKPDDRFQTFTDVKRALKALDRGNISSAGSSGSATALLRHGSHNPYLNRVMIKDPDHFFGRQKEVKRIYSRLDAPRPQSVSIVGERRMGKSSLLNYLYHRRNRRLLMENHRNCVFLYMDFQRVHEIDTEKFIDMLFSMINYELGEEISATRSGRSLEMLNAAIEKLDKKGMRVVVLMDEFDAITNNARFEMQFFSFLRYLANNYRVAYVTSSHSDLQQMCHDKDIADSPFFNIFSTLQLRPFSHEEAMGLIKMPSEREGIPLEAHADRIIALSGYFPLFIQIACSGAYEALGDHPGNEPDWNQVDRVFTEEAEPHFAFVWERMDDATRENLRRAAAGKEIDRRFMHVNEELVRRGYLIEQQGGDCRLFSEPFRRFVLAQSAKQESASGSGWRRWLGRR